MLQATSSPLWAITPEASAAVRSAWRDFKSLGPDGLARAQALFDRSSSQALEEPDPADGVAVIPVNGPLVRHHSLFSFLLGGTSYAETMLALQAALDSPLVHSIILDINSPGGEVDGCAELADAIVAARGLKPIEVYVGGMGASAAYWLSSAGARITCAETALLGSIGVRLMLLDESRRDAMEGIRTVDIISTQSPGKRDTPIDAEVVARAQATVDQLASVFVRTVAKNRGCSEKQVLTKFGQGDVMVGAAAVAVGLADRLGSLEMLVAELAAQHQPVRRLSNR